MYFDLNVAEKQSSGRYTHLFAVAPRSIRSHIELAHVFPIIARAFPAPQYQISVTRYDESGIVLTDVAMAEILAVPEHIPLLNGFHPKGRL